MRLIGLWEWRQPLSATSLSTCPLLQREESCPAALQSLSETWLLLQSSDEHTCQIRYAGDQKHSLNVYHVIQPEVVIIFAWVWRKKSHFEHKGALCVCRSGKTSRKWWHWAEPWSLVSIWKWKRMDTALVLLFRTWHTGEPRPCLITTAESLYCSFPPLHPSGPLYSVCTN